MAGERDLLVVGQFLAVKHDDRVAIDGVLDGVAIGRLRRLREIYVGNLGDNLGIGWRECDAHDRIQRLYSAG